MDRNDNCKGYLFFLFLKKCFFPTKIFFKRLLLLPSKYASGLVEELTIVSEGEIYEETVIPPFADEFIVNV